MKVLYLHGLGSRDFVSHQTSEKVSVIKEIYLDIISPVFNYEPNNKERTYTIYKELSELIKKEKIELIIGNSYGGYLSFWLGVENDIKSISFNPPLGKFFSLDSYRKNTTKKILILSKDDGVVPYKNTLKFLEENNSNNQFNVYTHLIEAGHLIPPNKFKESIELFNTDVFPILI